MAIMRFTDKDGLHHPKGSDWQWMGCTVIMDIRDTRDIAFGFYSITSSEYPEL